MGFSPASYGASTTAEPKVISLPLCIHAGHEPKHRAWLVSIDGDTERAVWLPKSEVTVGDINASDFADVHLPEWLAINRKLIR